MDYPNLPSGYQDPMQYRQLHNLPYPSPEGQNKMGSSAQYRSDAITSPNVHGHPFIARQPSASNREINLEGFASSSGNYLPPLQQPDLYTASAQFDQDALRLPRSSTIHPHASPQSWPPYEHPIPLDVALSLRYDSFPSPSPFPPPRLSPPSYSNGGLSRGIHPLAGSLDPATGVFYRTPDHPRLRTAQACEKCRTRKAKCSGEHPSCKRCIARGLVCEYAKEGRVRGPNKPKLKPPPTTVAATDEPFSLAPSRARTMSANDSTSTSGNSSEHHDVASILSSFRANETRLGAPSFSGVPGSSQARRNSLSLDEHRPNRSRPPNLHLDTASNHDRRIGVPILQPSPGNSLYWTERVGAQYTQDSVRHEYQQSPRNDLPIPEVQGLSYPSHNFPGPEPTVVPPFARFPLSLQPTIDLNGQYLGSGFDLAGSSATEGGTDTSTLMRYQQSQQISV
ncbi:hypothetical protein CC2G_002866 [Coprinopsis cinerea AmutBmut pab1-1]|nr:hypothetical protein CC2G_002866 [Coprinopsis cinerea AmutBmut pab1-1]